ncbi:uncharacterized protein LOC135817607 [Sycon ciliatum]|uniref:uncharacterized protein LOC135817607 n=1 Tax=Sycon ciliatum TaxID=27933 RepID=UPI0031F6D0BE
MFLVYVLLLFGAGASEGAWEDGDDGVDRRNGDLPGMPVKLEPGNKPSDCADMCVANEQCVSWAFGKANCTEEYITLDWVRDSAAPMCWLKGQVTQQSADKCRVSGVRNTTLLPLAFTPLPTAAVKPTGWLLNQLKTQATGLSGHLSLFWPDVNQSVWIGGQHDPGLNERTPYWLNGFVPLAYQLQDKSLLDQVQSYVTYVLDHQTADGWLGPEPDHKDGNAYWSKFPMLMALTQYHEANPGETRVVPAIMKFLHIVHESMFQSALGGWSAARYQDFVLTCHWLLDNNKTDEEQFVWDVAELAHQQGNDWKGFFDADTFPTTAVTQTTMYTHGVNNGQAIKSEGVWWRQSRNQSDNESSYIRMNKLDKYHGMPSGIFSADEHLAGLMPSRGVELCAVVEAMFSYEVLFSITGDPVFAERAEMIAYNALPATFTKDMWAHQYLQQPNEMNAIHSDDHVWTHDGPDSTLYGLAPNYGCCTANFNQGWPKYTSRLVMTTPDNGLVVGMWAPCTVTSPLGNLTITSNYPFGDNATIDIELVSSITTALPVYLRIPSWSAATKVAVNGAATAHSPTAGQLYKVLCNAGHSCQIEVMFDAELRLERRFNNAAAIYRGALLYGMTMIEDYTVLRQYQFESKDYQVTGKSAWNYALHLASDTDLKSALTFIQGIMPLTASPYHLATVPVHLLAKGQLLSNWKLAHNAAAAPPQSPLKNNGSDGLDDIVLVPYGSTCLRMAEMPTVTLT